MVYYLADLLDAVEQTAMRWTSVTGQREPIAQRLDLFLHGALLSSFTRNLRKRNIERLHKPFRKQLVCLIFIVGDLSYMSCFGTPKAGCQLC